MNNFITIYGDMAYDALRLTLTLSCYFAAQYGDEFSRYRFKHNKDAYATAYDKFCDLYLVDVPG